MSFRRKRPLRAPPFVHLSCVPQAGAGSCVPQAGAGSCVPQAGGNSSFAALGDTLSPIIDAMQAWGTEYKKHFL